MQDKNPYLEYKQLEIVPWWLIAGPVISGNILLIGKFNETELTILSNISQNLEHLDIHSEFDISELQSVSESKNYDVVLVKTLDAQISLDFEQANASKIVFHDNLPIIILLEENPLYIKNIFHKFVSIIKSVFFDVRASQIRSIFSNCEIVKYETISYDCIPHASFPPSTYYTNKNPFLGTEKIKRILLNSRLSRVFYNSHIWAIGNNKQLFVEHLINDLKRNDRIEWEGNNIRLLKILHNSNKLIISLTSKGTCQPEYIVIVPIMEATLDQRKNEKSAIEALQNWPSVAKYFVNEVFEGTICNQVYFAMKEFTGITVDHPNSGLDKMTENAMDVITSMAVPEIASVNTHQTKTVADVSAELTRLLVSRYPYHKNLIEDIGGKLAHYRGLPLVKFMHGDTKIENFVINGKTNRIVGMIDLELAEFPGIPLSDLFYLITYNYHIVHGEPFYRAFTRIVKDELLPSYQKYIENYCNMHKIDQKQKNMCLVLFFLHHFAKRMRFSKETNVNYEEFIPGCQLVQQILETTPYDLANSNA